MTDDLDKLLSEYDPLADWPNCSTADCQHKVCLWASRTLCYPCSLAVYGLDEMKRRWAETHDEPFDDKDDDV